METPSGFVTTTAVTSSGFAESIHRKKVNLVTLKAKTALATIVKGKPVRCVLVGGGTPCDGKSKPASSDRFVAQCFAQASDIARTMVEQGFACEHIKFSGGHYSQGGNGNACETHVPPRSQFRLMWPF